MQVKRRGIKIVQSILTVGMALISVLLWIGVNQTPAIQAQNPVVRGPFIDPVVRPKSQDGDLRRLPKVESTGRPRVFPLRGRVPPSVIPPTSAFPSFVPQTPLAPSTSGALSANFEGISFTSAGWPPDTNGDVGPNHFIQAVNISFAVYAKTGSLMAGPTTFDSLWSSAASGTPCDNQNRGDPVVLYDDQSHRWLLTDFAFPLDTSGNIQKPFYECIAVSKTNDPVSGGWYLYAFLADANLLNDYPKLGAWSDGIYMTANMYDLTTNAVNVRVWALDRNALVSGGGVSSVHVDLPTCLGTAATCPYFSLLPGNLRGALPPSGSPNYLANIETANTTSGLPFTSSVIHLWKFQVDWSNPGNSTLTGPTNLSVPSFTQPLIVANGTVSMSLVPQPGTSTLLDTLGDRLMMQAQYRNLPALGAQSIWLAHTVKSGNVTGIRWYEIGIVGGSFSLNQQGTFDPGDGNFRWLPSLAVDGNGNMTVGYSVSGTNTYPGLRYAGRLRGDPLGQLSEGEATLINGTGSQGNVLFNITRWGDYSAMTVDPTDDSTFWYTSEYFTSAGFGLAWQTRIGAFKMSVPAANYRYYFPVILKDH